MNPRKAVEFTMDIGCALDCSFCPQTNLKGAYKSEIRRMTMENFLAMLDKVPVDREVHLSGFSEGFLHPEAADMLHEASNRGHSVHIYTTLIGLNPRHVEKLKQTKIDHIRIHVPDQTALVIPDAQWIKRHDLFLSLGRKATYMSMGQQTEGVASYLAALGIVAELPTMLSRGGNLWSPENGPIQGRLTCNAQRWYMHTVLPNGDLQLCSMDYSLLMPVGNLLAQTYEEIEEVASRYEHDLDPPANSPCRSCEWAIAV